jgi:hypothetical protein
MNNIRNIKWEFLYDLLGILLIVIYILIFDKKILK